MDVMMPGLDGIETARRLREISTLNPTWIVFLTARSEEYTQVAAFQSGADAFLTKPIKSLALTSRLDALFHRSGQTTPPGEDPLVLGELSLSRRAYTLGLQ